jgi:hypothetical protein
MINGGPTVRSLGILEQALSAIFVGLALAPLVEKWHSPPSVRCNSDLPPGVVELDKLGPPPQSRRCIVRLMVPLHELKSNRSRSFTWPGT